MEFGRRGQRGEMSMALNREALSLAMEAHRSTTTTSTEEEKPLYVCKSSPEVVVFAFAGSWLVNDWFAGKEPFGETKLDQSLLKLFPSLRSIGNDEPAVVNKAFLDRFLKVFKQTQFKEEVEKAVKDKKKMVFTGHSSGGAVAIFATLWFLENYIRLESGGNRHVPPPRCVTFGSPLIGNRILPHALGREKFEHKSDKWANCFTHFVMQYDIVPRIMLAPLSSIKQNLQPVLEFFDKKFQGTDSTNTTQPPTDEALDLLMNVMRNASAVASRVACDLMESTNPLLKGLSAGYIKISPYRPFGTYIFCSEKGERVVVENPDAVLQLLFYFSQLGPEAKAQEIALCSLNEKPGYEVELNKSSKTLHLNGLIKDLNGSPSRRYANTPLHELSTRARLCLAAAEEAENRKKEKQNKIESKKRTIEEYLSQIKEYKRQTAEGEIGYYGAFKIQNNYKDFEANITRLKLATIWDEIIELLKNYELPDEFEMTPEWLELGTRFRRLVEPLDIANYYRHDKGNETKNYLGPKGRPKRYRYTQRWHEHANRMPFEDISESCFLAKIEDLKIETLQVEEKVKRWVGERNLDMDVFWDKSVFCNWWKTFPESRSN